MSAGIFARMIALRSSHLAYRNGGPMVRIHLPPAASLEQTGSALFPRPYWRIERRIAPEPSEHTPPDSSLRLVVIYGTSGSGAGSTFSGSSASSIVSRSRWACMRASSSAPSHLATTPLPNNFVHAEWITLHDNSNFRGFVAFLRTELDRVGPAHADLCRDLFSRAVALELSFFEAAYTT
jgi:hypothetical protein